MAANDGISIPSFLGIQLSNSDVIPIDVRYIDNRKIVFSIPQHNAKQDYYVSGIISEDVNRSALKMTLNPFLKVFSDKEQDKFQMNDLNKQGVASRLSNISETDDVTSGPKKKKQKTNPIRNQHQNNYPSEPFEPFKYEIENLKPSFGYKIPMLPEKNDDPEFFKNTYQDYTIPVDSDVIDFREPFITGDTIKEKKLQAEALFHEGNKLFHSENYDREINIKALKLFRQSQILYHEVYPDSFHTVALPGLNREFIQNLDPDAIMVAPKQFIRILKRRLQLAELRSKGLLKDRTLGVLYPSRSAHAKKRVRNEFGIFIN